MRDFVADPVDPSDPLAVLVATREWLSDPDHWCRYDRWQGPGGLVRDRSKVCKTCVRGAFSYVSGGSVAHDEPPLVCDELRAALGDRHPAKVNDNRGYRAILRGLDRAIKARKRQIVYTACEIKGPNLIAVRRCRVCGAMAEVDRALVQGRLPELCRREHGNISIEIHVVVPNMKGGM